MTCIVGIVDKIKEIVYIGGDSASVIPGTASRRFITKEKVFKKDKLLFGFCGSFRALQLVQYELEVSDVDLAVNRLDGDIFKYLITDLVPKIQKLLEKHEVLKRTAEEDIRGYLFLIGYKDKLFRVDVDFQVMEYQDDYDSVGSGSKYAFGSLHATKFFKLKSENRITMALQAASYFNGGVVKPFYILNT